MMRDNTSTKEKIGDLTVRKPGFGYAKREQLAISEEAFKDAFFSALSIFLPPGERFFINSLRQAREGIEDAEVKAEIQAFIGQEAQHSKQHIEFNRFLERYGYPAIESEQFVARLLDMTGKLFSSTHDHMTITVVIEHYTAVLSNIFIQDEGLQDKLHDSVKSLYLWHSMEEIEHKGVAYDIYQDMGDNYPKRVAMMTLFSGAFLLLMVGMQLRFLNTKGQLFKWSTLRQASQFWFNPRIPKVLKGLSEFYAPDFHPWQVDDRHLINEIINLAPEELLNSIAA